MHLLLMKTGTGGSQGHRIELWLERSPTTQVAPYLHAVSYRGSVEDRRRTIRVLGDEPLAVSARRLYDDLCRHGLVD